MANSDDKEVVTKTVLNEAVDAILGGMGKLVDEVRSDTKVGIESLQSEMNSRFDNLEAKVSQTKLELKDEIDGLKADLSGTASRRELEELKAKVN
jgi:hypothetical protein